MFRQSLALYKSLERLVNLPCITNGCHYCTRRYASSMRLAQGSSCLSTYATALPTAMTCAMITGNSNISSVSSNNSYMHKHDNSMISFFDSNSSSFNTSSQYMQRRWISVNANNPYATLGIKQGATKEEIKKAYRVMARKHHPDAPGGDHKKFQEIQEAYDQIKSGVWIQKGGSGGGDSGDGSEGGSGGDGSRGNRYTGFRYTTRTHAKNKVSYDEFYTEMHTGKVKKNPFEDDEDMEEGDRSSSTGGESSGGGGGEGRNREGGADPRRNPFLMSELSFQAWMRFILMWCILFSVLRVVLFFLFPPHWEKPQRKPPPKDLRRQKEHNKPAPKPLARANDPLIA